MYTELAELDLFLPTSVLFNTFFSFQGNQFTAYCNATTRKFEVSDVDSDCNRPVDDRGAIRRSQLQLLTEIGIFSEKVRLRTFESESVGIANF